MQEKKGCNTTSLTLGVDTPQLDDRIRPQAHFRQLLGV